VYYMMFALVFLFVVLVLLVCVLFRRRTTLPVFETLQELENSPWKEYFLKVYNELPPESDFPIRIGDFSILYDEAPIDKPRYVRWIGQCPMFENELYSNMSLTNDPPGTTWVYHPPPFKPLEGLVEVTHCADSFITTYETKGMWMYSAPGSGVYYDLGRTIAFNEHKDAVAHFLNRKCKDFSLLHGYIECIDDFSDLITEASKNYDSIQFLAHGDMRCGNTAVEIMSLKNVGDYPCGNKSGKGLFRSGWKGSRECVCDTTKLCLNCSLTVH
jgi:hypothetical protein